jgi:GNAT superfamily N-acetyltransferase
LFYKHRFAIRKIPACYNYWRFLSQEHKPTMPDIQVRQASLDDTQAISALTRSRIGVWQRMNVHGQVEDVSYEILSIYERWLHGGPWMSIETGAIQLNHLLLGAGIPLVAELDGRVLAYAEAYHGLEPAPFGDHLHLGHLVVHQDHAAAELDHALIAYLVEQTRTLKCQRITAHTVANDADTSAFYTQHGLKPLARVQRFNLSAKTGQIFYRAVEHLDADSAQMNEWFMPVGRLGSARQQWEILWPRIWNALPEIQGRRTYRLRFSAAGQDAFIFCQQQLYAPRSADIYCWSPKPLSGQLLTAIRDWAHREGYRTLVMVVNEDTIKTLGTEAEPDGYYQDVYALDV